jgi:hypothetical protein
MHKSELHNVHTFSSPAEFGEFCLVKSITYEGDSHGAWTGYLKAGAAAKLAITGDASHVASAEKMLEKFNTQIETSSFEDMPSVAGCYPCVPEALMGEPECMREPMEVSTEHSPLTIIVDTACSANVSAAQMETRGIAILAVVMALSASRPITLKTISVSYGFKNKEGDSYSVIAVELPTTPIDLATAAYVLTHVGYTRNLKYGYALKYLGFDNGKWPTFNRINYGNVQAPEYQERVKKYMQVEGDVLYIPAAYSDDGVIKEPEKWIQERLNEYQHSI